MSKKRTPINESELMELMAGNNSENTTPKKESDTPPSPPKVEQSITEDEPTNPEPKPKQEQKLTKPKKTDIETYESLFFNSGDTSARNGKSVYIRPEFHKRIARIVQVISEDKISLYNYLDNVLEQHFNEYEKEITKAFKDKYKPIF